MQVQTTVLSKKMHEVHQRCTCLNRIPSEQPPIATESHKSPCCVPPIVSLSFYAYRCLSAVTCSFVCLCPSSLVTPASVAALSAACSTVSGCDFSLARCSKAVLVFSMVLSTIPGLCIASNKYSNTPPPPSQKNHILKNFEHRKMNCV